MNRKGTSRVRKVAVPTSNHPSLSLDDLEADRKREISKVYLKEFEREVYVIPVGADVAVSFFELDESTPRPEQIRTMARFVSESLCDENGNEFIPLELAMKLPIKTLDKIVTGIYEGYTSARESKRGNASRR